MSCGWDGPGADQRHIKAFRILEFGFWIFSVLILDLGVLILDATVCKSAFDSLTVVNHPYCYCKPQ